MIDVVLFVIMFCLILVNKSIYDYVVYFYNFINDDNMLNWFVRVFCGVIYL